MPELPPIGSICVYAGSSDAADSALLAAAGGLGEILAGEGIRLVYGGGGIGLMGACARAVHAAGGRVLGVMPEFLRQSEILFDEVDTIVVRSMHERKMLMFEESDAFVALPGGIGTLEEVVELLSWRRLGLHAKPVVFYNPAGFWDPLFAFFDKIVILNLTPPAFANAWRAVDEIEEILPAIREMAAAPSEEFPMLMPKDLPRSEGPAF
jgi:uncharacterized protein (TIGR00730 family)